MTPAPAPAPSCSPVPTLIFVLCVSRHLSLHFCCCFSTLSVSVFVASLCVFFLSCCCCCCYPLKCTFNCRQFDVYMQPARSTISFIYLSVHIYLCVCACVCLLYLPCSSCFLHDAKLPTGTWRETKRFGSGLSSSSRLVACFHAWQAQQSLTHTLIHKHIYRNRHTDAGAARRRHVKRFLLKPSGALL